MLPSVTECYLIFIYINMLENEEEKKKKYRMIFNGLPLGMQQACREWAKLESWNETTWIETLQALIGMFEDYREAAQWIRTEVLAKLEEKN